MQAMQSRATAMPLLLTFTTVTLLYKPTMTAAPVEPLPP